MPHVRSTIFKWVRFVLAILPLCCLIGLWWSSYRHPAIISFKLVRANLSTENSHHFDFENVIGEACVVYSYTSVDKSRRVQPNERDGIQMTVNPIDRRWLFQPTIADDGILRVLGFHWTCGSARNNPSLCVPYWFLFCVVATPTFCYVRRWRRTHNLKARGFEVAAGTLS